MQTENYPYRRGAGALWPLLLSTLVVLAALIWAASQPSFGAEPKKVKIGVLAFRGPVHTMHRWSPTTDYLTRAIPGHVFEIVPLTLQETSEAARDHTVDFILTNSGNYVDLEARFGVSRIATMRTPKPVEAGNVFGAVIFTSADKAQGADAIRTIGALRDRSFIAVNKNGFGGFQMAWRELMEGGIDPFADFSHVTFAGFPQDEVVYAVQQGKIDAGTVRTGTLENMEAEGKIKLSDFYILNRRHHAGFPYEVSTRLYPEWPFARVADTPEDLSQKVAIALLSMAADDPAAKAGRYAGWAVPGDYQKVHDLFLSLRIGPYAELGRVTLKDFLANYWEWFLFAFVLIIITIAWATRTEAVVVARTRELREANAELEKQIAERRRAEDATRRREHELAHVWRFSTMGEMATSLAHEINQPLSAISNYARGSARRLRAPDADQERLLDAMEQIARQAERAGSIIQRVRTFLRKEEPGRAPLDVNAVLREMIDMLAPDAKAHGVEIREEFSGILPPVEGDPVQIQQVIVNLMRNGCESMSCLSPAERVLSVETGVSNRNDVVIRVRDKGTGIAHDDLDRLFDPFFTTKENGLGMGLSISRSIIESHGGRLEVDSTPGQGTLFTVKLPATNTDDQSQSRAEETTDAA